MSTTDTPEGPLPSGNVLLVPGSLRGGVIEKYGEGDSWTATVGADQRVGLSGDPVTGVLGGQLVEFITGDRLVVVATADSVVVAGVAMFNQIPGEQVTVASEGVWFLVASEAITAGQRVAAATGGAVKVADDVFTDETPPVDLGTASAAQIIGFALATQATPGGLVPVKLTL